MKLEVFRDIPTGNLCNAHKEVRPLSSRLKPLISNHPIVGVARTVRIQPGHNKAIHLAVHSAKPGDVLVVDGGQSDRFGPFGDILASGCMAKNMAGAVFDCTIRDSTEIAELGFQVFCRGFHPEPTAKIIDGEVNIPVSVGGVLINPGDIIVGDDDGVVVFAPSIYSDVLNAAQTVVSREEEIRARIKAGESTYEIFGLG